MRGRVHGAAHARRHLSDDEELAESLWRQVLGALVTAGHNVVMLPERRLGHRDWVVEGLHMPRCVGAEGMYTKRGVKGRAKCMHIVSPFCMHGYLKSCWAVLSFCVEGGSEE